MDLNICLYCEMPLSDDAMSFCSLACQDQEASKSATYIYPVYYHHSPSVYNHQKKSISNQTSMMNQSTPRSIPLATPPTKIMSHHRPRSFFYSKDYPTRGRPNTSSIAVAHFDISSEYPLPSIGYSLYNSHILDNTSSISTISYESSDTDSVNNIIR